MKNALLYLFLLFISNALLSQTKYYTKSGNINFEASIPSFEEVKATNKTVSSVLHIKTGEIAVLALVRGFRFKVALMEEHFNENYADSNTFPKMSFTGKIEEFSFKNLNNTPKIFNLNGALTFHGKTITINPKITLFVEENTIYLRSNFSIKSEDFNIKIPKVVRKKVAETVNVTINFILIPKN